MKERGALDSDRGGYFGIMPILASQLSANSGHLVMGKLVRLNPNACPPFAYKCISTGTPAFLNAL